MADIKTFWERPIIEQQSIQKEIEQEAKNQEDAQIPTPYTLTQALDTDAALAVCASSLFILIVENRYELGGGYGVHIIALSEFINKHFEALEQVEQYLEATAPYKQNSRVWVPLPSYNSGMLEMTFLNKLWGKP